MVAVLRFVANVLLAILVIVLVLAILLAGYGAVMADAWENTEADEGVAGGAWLNIGGQSVYYQIVGPQEGTAILLIHGSGVEGSQIWNGNALALSRSGLRVISVDLNGFGYSNRDASSDISISGQAAMLAELLDELQAEQVTAVAQGWGGTVALRLAADHPDLVRQVVLISPRLTANPLISPTLLKLPYVSQGVAWVVGSGGPVWELVRRLGFQNPAALNGTLLADMRGPTHVRGTVDALLARLLAQPEKISEHDISQVRVPVLIIAGEKDRFVKLEDVERLAKRFPRATLMTVRDAGHYVHIEQSLEVNRRLVEFCLGANP